MTAPKVRADYEQLKAVADSFGSHAQATQQTLRTLEQQMAVLQGGDWVGQGAQAFYTEMDTQLVPTMNRLIGALEQAAQTTQEINRLIQQAEGEAAAVFRVDGQAAAGGSSSPALAGPGAGDAAAFAAARPGPRRSHGKANSSQPQTSGATSNFLFDQLAKQDPKLAEQVRKDKALMTKLRLLGQPGGIESIRVGHLKDPGALVEMKGDQVSLNAKHPLAALADVADSQLYGQIRLLDGLGDKLAAEVKKDPVLMEQLREWDRTGIKLKLGTTPGHSVLNQNAITLDPAKPLDTLRDGLRSWQRGEPVQEFTIQEAQGNKELYVQRNTQLQMQADARQLIHEYAAYQTAEGDVPAILPNGKPTTHQADYGKVVRDYMYDGEGEIAVPAYEVRQLLAKEPPGSTNQQQYEKDFGQRWGQPATAGRSQ